MSGNSRLSHSPGREGGGRSVRVLASGCFDLLHYGHLRYLEEAKKLGGPGAELIVVVARDSTILREKGRPPLMPEEHRRALVEALKPVDRAILGMEGMDVRRIIDALKPDIIALGYDQGGLKEAVTEAGFKNIVRLEKYADTSSSTIKSRINSGRCPS